MDGVSDDGAVRSFLETLEVGDLCTGVITAGDPSRAQAVTLDGFPTRALGSLGSADTVWGRGRTETYEVGRRITAGVVAVDLDEGRVRLSTAAAEHPELWAFLSRCRRGDILSGTVAAIESFGVFVALDDGPAHPVFPGVGFISIPELSWQYFDAVTDIVRTGERVRCEFLQFDTWNGEARLSLRATQPDPFRAFAAGVEVGRILPGTVTRLVPFGAFVRLADGIEGLVHPTELE
ncbi:S1 RNA-binding domain-containing protein [Kitasatospora sp. NPDC059571]|uniref:S1 RNA-binding domain-containing protein n=1 Tax=Kitasatospora sp. NPDC059571 TaxID=3346871 RepID=UPI00369B9458